jgi:5-formyltetrahydrofolate cyclo-ligase
MAPDTRARFEKRVLRRRVVASILEMDLSQRTDEEQALAARFAQLPGFASAGTVLLFVTAFAEELDTRAFFDLALEAGKRVLCPRVDLTEKRLRLLQIRSLASDLQPGLLSIFEPVQGCPEVQPEQVDWALIPGLAFNDACFRLGRGGGYYDRLLPRMRPDCQCWSVGLSVQLVPELPVEPHDAPVNGVCLPGRIVLRS